MEGLGLLVAGGVVALIVLSSGRYPPRYRPWRGPTWGDKDEVQWEHLWLYRTPPSSGGDDDDNDGEEDG